MNLIHDPWIPIRRRSGEREWITPWQLTERHDDDPIMAVNTPRADFDGALMQFLIGLLQTALPPGDYDGWIEGYEEPPEPSLLREAMASYEHAFELFGNGPRFMQDFTLRESDTKHIGALFIEAPGGNTLKNNLDHFVKRGGLHALCPACAASALFCLQTNAPSGGVGHRTSLRGGGPLTTLVVADPRTEDTGLVATLWRNCWLNVLEKEIFARQSGNSNSVAPEAIFPWLGPTRTSESKTGRPTTPEDGHPLQMYWGMPRRIRLLQSEQIHGTCDLCKRDSEHLCVEYQTKNYGANYEGGWRHPLSPHLIDNSGAASPVHAQPGGLSYRHWLGLVQYADGKPLQREPAEVVQAFSTGRTRDIPGQFRVWAFGYDMDNMKARCWYESIIPLYHVPPELRPRFEDNLSKLVFAAGEVVNNLRTALKNAWFRRPQDKSGDMSVVSSAFWQRTEAQFYASLGEIQDVLSDASAEQEIRARWLQNIGNEALALFDQWALTGPIEDSDPRRIAVARHKLSGYNRSRKLLGGLGLPVSTRTNQKDMASPAA